MVEELKLAIKIDDASIEQSLLKQFANAQKMADKVVLDFKNVNFDDKQIEAKFKEMQKKAGQNPIDLTIGGNTLDMLGQIDKRLTEIFSIGKGKSFIDSSSTVADIGKIENKINELNKKYEEMQKKLSSVGSEGISGKDVSLVDNAEFQKLSQEVQNTKSELSDLKDVISNLTSDNEGLGNFADQLDDRLRGLDNTVLDLTKRLQTLYSVIEQNPETNISLTSDSTVEQKIKSESELNAEIEKRENIIRELQQLQEKLTVHEDFHGNDRYFADQLPTEEEIREADKRIKQLTGTNNIFNVDKLIQDRNEWLSEVKYSLEEYDDLIKANDQKALDEYTTRGLSRIGGAESFFGYEDNNFSIASKFVEEKEKIQNEINDLYTDLDKLDEKMNLNSNNSSVDNTVQSQEKLQSELKETQKQAEKTAQAVKESTTTASTEQKKDAFPDKDVSASVESATNSIKEENNVLEQNTQKVKENTQAKKQNVNANLNKYDKRLDSYNGKVDKYQATIDRLKDGGWTSDTYLKNVQAVKNAVKEYETLLNELKGKDASLVTSDDISKLDEYEKKIKDTIATVTNMSAAEKGYNFVSGQKELDKIHKILDENTRMSSSAKATIKAYYKEIESGNPSMSLDKIHGEIMKIVNAEKEAGRAGKSMWSAIKEKAWYGAASAIGTYFGVNDIFRYGREIADAVIQLDTATTELRKVSDATDQRLVTNFENSAKTAKQLGSTISDVISATADWSRMGYDIDQAEELARVSTLYKNVGDGIDIETANNSLISTLQGFQLDASQAESIIDKFNEVANNYAIDSAGIGEALQRSAASFNAANTDLSKSIALITATNEVVQNPDSVGRMMPTYTVMYNK